MLFKKSLLTVITLSSLVSLSATAANNNQQQITLSGSISAVSCDVTLNGGQSTLNVGNFPSASFTAAGTQVGAIPLNISLIGCDKASAEKKGELLVQGQTSAGNQNLFVNDSSATVGFMLKDMNSNQIANNTPVPLDVKIGNNTYSMTVGMGSLSTKPENGIYSAPIVIAYVSD